MRTLFLNPPSFEKFDGGAGARYQATREVTSFWYPVWLAGPAGMREGDRLVDGPAQGLTADEVVAIARDYDLLVLFTSAVGLSSDVQIVEAIKHQNPDIKVAFVGPQATIQPEQTLNASPHIDFVTRREFDFTIDEIARGHPLESIQGLSYKEDGRIVHNPDRPPIHDLDALPFACETYARDLDITKYNIPYLLHPYVSFYTSRGCPALCTFCLWPQTFSGHPWRTRSVDHVIREVKRYQELFPQSKEIFFDDDTFPWEKERTHQLCAALKPLGITWSCNARVTTKYETLKAMKDAGLRLLVVGFESGDNTILKNIKKGATVERAREFMRDCKKLGIVVHGDFQVGLPGETRETIEKTMRFAMELDPETIQVSVSHPYPGTEFDDYVRKNDYFAASTMSDDVGHQLPAVEYPGLSREYMLEMVDKFYARYYFRPKVIFRFLKRAALDGYERKRIMKEAREFFATRAKRKDFHSKKKVAAAAS